MLACLIARFKVSPPLPPPRCESKFRFRRVAYSTFVVYLVVWFPSSLFIASLMFCGGLSNLSVVR